jgi:hypothetical protein
MVSRSRYVIGRTPRRHASYQHTRRTQSPADHRTGRHNAHDSTTQPSMGNPCRQRIILYVQHEEWRHAIETWLPVSSGPVLRTCRVALSCIRSARHPDRTDIAANNGLNQMLESLDYDNAYNISSAGQNPFHNFRVFPRYGRIVCITFRNPGNIRMKD